MSQPTALPDLDSNVLVAVGANDHKDRSVLLSRIRSALNDIDSLHIATRAVSRFYTTPCFPVGAGPDYVNAALLLSTSLSPDALLAHLHAVEAAYGRTRTLRWGQRSLDLDIIGFDDLILPDRATWAAWRDLPLAAQLNSVPDRLIVPHPRVQERGFVLIPLNDIAPDWRHPVSGQSARDMLATLPDSEKSQITPL